MVRSAAGPWAISALVHGVALSVVLALVLTWLPAPPSSLRLRLQGPTATGSSPSEPVSGGPSLPGSPDAAVNLVSEAVTWQSTQEFSLGEDFYRTLSSFDVSLEDVLIGSSPAEPVLPEIMVTGWARESRTEGHALPPIPPAALLPSQGARWTLVFSIPAEGGFATAIEGLAQGMPDLDRWLEVWLQDITFPVSQTGSPYQLRWSLILQVGLPE